MFRGQYAGKLSNIVGAIKAFRTIHEARERINRPPFIETALTTQIWAACERARSYGRIAPIFGDGQIGKTESLMEYTRRNRTTTRYVRLPTEAPLRLVVQDLARVCNLNPDRSATYLRAEIAKFFDPQMLLIVDELQQISIGTRAKQRLVTVEFLREIFDRSGCGVVLCGTNEAMTEMESGENAMWLRQLRRRALPKMTLPNVAGDADIAIFAAHFKLPDDVPDGAVEHVRRIAREDGLGLLITYFQGAARMAASEECAVRWDHFLRTVRTLADQGTIRR